MYTLRYKLVRSVCSTYKNTRFLSSSHLGIYKCFFTSILCMVFCISCRFNLVTIRLICHTLMQNTKRNLCRYSTTMLGIISTGFEMFFMVLEPAYRTYKELAWVQSTTMTRGVAQAVAERRRQLMVHWIVYSAFRVTDWPAQILVPGYSFVKIAIIVWLGPGRGTETVYESIISPFLRRNERTADQWLTTVNRERVSIAEVIDGGHRNESAM